jgi:transcriptional regulator with XRE-family HTH domain
MNAARALRVARTRAGLSQTELARLAGVSPVVVNRVERGRITPRVDTLQRLLAAAGVTLTIEPRRGIEIDRGPIRELLQLPPRWRLDPSQIEALDELCRRRVRFVVVGDAAGRLHGAPIDVSLIEVVIAKDDAWKLQRALQSPSVSNLVVDTAEPNAEVWRDAEELSWLPAPRMRVLDAWIDAPSGFLASIEQLCRSASPERRELLSAMQEEVDVLLPGHRIYRDSARRMLRLPPPRRRYTPIRRRG